MEKQCACVHVYVCVYVNENQRVCVSSLRVGGRKHANSGPLLAPVQGLHVKKLSGTKFRQMLRSGEDIPEWFAFKSVVSVLREHTKQGK